MRFPSSLAPLTVIKRCFKAHVVSLRTGERATRAARWETVLTAHKGHPSAPRSKQGQENCSVEAILGGSGGEVRRRVTWLRRGKLL